MKKSLTRREKLGIVKKPGRPGAQGTVTPPLINFPNLLRFVNLVWFSSTKLVIDSKQMIFFYIDVLQM